MFCYLPQLSQFLCVVCLQGDELSSNKDGESLLLHRKTRVLSFTKKLTPSDTSTQGGFSVPKRHAEESLPPLVSILTVIYLSNQQHQIILYSLNPLSCHFYSLNYT
jgi:hypothetical protein